MTDDDLRDLIARAAREHTPDRARMRARFESGRAGQEGRRPPGPGVPGPRRGWVQPTAWAVAAACAVTAFALGTGGVPVSGGPDPGTPAASAATTGPARTAAPTTSAVPTAPLPDAVATSADATPRTHRATPRPGAPTTRSPGPATTGSAAGGRDRCDVGARLVDGPYVVANNQWNAEAGTGRQCVRLIGAPGDATGWTARWTWSGGEGTVKAYPSVVRGWHWDWGVTDDAFPVRPGPGSTLRTAWRYRVEGSDPGQADVSTILTLHAGAPAGPADVPDAEVHVVLSTFGIARPPRDAVLGTVRLPGAGTFDVTRAGPIWTLTSTTAADRREADVDLDLVGALRLLEGFGLDGRLVVSGLVAGADVSTGTAALVTTSYRVRAG